MDAIEENDSRKQETTNALMIRYRAYSRRVRMILYLGGVLQDRTRSAIRSYIVGFIVILICLSQCFFMINFISQFHIKNLILIVKCFGQLGTFVAPVLMAACFLRKREKLIKLHETLHDLFEQELARNPETTLANLYAFDRPFFLMFCFTFATVLLYICPPLISIIGQIIHHTEPRKYRLPFMVKFPWIVQLNGGFLFYLHYLYHLFVGWFLLFTINGVDGLFGFYAFQISSILHAIAVKLTNQRSQEPFSEMLKTCVRIHRRLLQYSHMLEDIWQLIILRMLLVNSILICALIFEASQFTDITNNEVFVFIFYISFKLLQTFMYSWSGNFITSASQHFCEGIYFSKWPDSNLDRHVRTNVIMIMMQKPMIIKALKVSSVNVNMFTNIVNTAMSYFFLLQSLNEAK